jgi:hypothetical protein
MDSLLHAWFIDQARTWFTSTIAPRFWCDLQEAGEPGSTRSATSTPPRRRPLPLPPRPCTRIRTRSPGQPPPQQSHGPTRPTATQGNGEVPFPCHGPPPVTRPRTHGRKHGRTCAFILTRAQTPTHASARNAHLVWMMLPLLCSTPLSDKATHARFQQALNELHGAYQTEVRCAMRTLSYKGSPIAKPGASVGRPALRLQLAKAQTLAHCLDRQPALVDEFRALCPALLQVLSPPQQASPSPT